MSACGSGDNAAVVLEAARSRQAGPLDALALVLATIDAVMGQSMVEFMNVPPEDEATVQRLQKQEEALQWVRAQVATQPCKVRLS